jgi:predicted dehydrogenase
MKSLDMWRDLKRDVRVAVESWLAARPVTEQYVTRSLDLRMVWNYLRHVGPMAAARKVRSRLAERGRNRKCAGIGVGIVIESSPEADVPAGTRVVFFAPNHSIEWPRICLDQDLVRATTPGNHLSAADAETALERLECLDGWSPYSGIPLDAATVRSTLQSLIPNALHGTDRTVRRAGGGRTVSERRESRAPLSGRPSAVLFGHGHYAKTHIIPCIRRHLSLAAIHEIDPDQIGPVAGMGITFDTSPYPRVGDRYDAWFIAGFHHMHTDLAAHALRAGAYAIVEKPLATTRNQFTLLEAAIKTTPHPRLFTCFHRRYAAINTWVRSDLGIAGGDPVDMHCLVYEIPLPLRHWYNWPNSGSRLVSNGCHWLDYFLFMNDYSAVVERFARSMRGPDVLAYVRLENGAQLSLSITDAGSDRLGVRDVIDMRAGRHTARIIDAARYESESHSRVLRRARVNPINAYGRMYDSICRAVVANEAADRVETLRSTELMLDLDEELECVRRSAAPREDAPAYR